MSGDLPVVLSRTEYDALLARGTREIETAVQIALAEVAGELDAVSRTPRKWMQYPAAEAIVLAYAAKRMRS